MRSLAVRLSCSAGLVFWLVACGFSRADDQPRTIVVGGDVNHEAVHTFQRARGRHPTHAELLAIHRVWIDNEILYREGSKLPLDAATAAHRENVIFQALAAINARVTPSSVTDAELQRWFESRRREYEQPARFDFEDATPPAEGAEAAARSLAERLNGTERKDERARVRAFQGRPESNLVQSYGAETAAALAKAQPGTWLPLRTRDGWRAMRLIALTPTIHAAFETQRDAIRRDWINATVAERRGAALQALRAEYKIEFAAPFECHADK